MLRIIANILVCIVIASSTYAIFLLVKRSNELEKRVERGEKVNWFQQNEVWTPVHNRQYSRNSWFVQNELQTPVHNSQYSRNSWFVQNEFYAVVAHDQCGLDGVDCMERHDGNHQYSSHLATSD